jgi:hypothetical protein
MTSVFAGIEYESSPETSSETDNNSLSATSEVLNSSSVTAQPPQEPPQPQSIYPITTESVEGPKSLPTGSQQTMNLPPSRTCLYAYLESIKFPPKPSPPPPSKTSDLSRLIESYWEKKQRLGIDVNQSLIRSKQFRNPNIYSKLIEFCGIDEIGSNFSPLLFDPHGFPPEVFAQSILEAQLKKEEDKMSHLRQQIRKPLPPSSSSSSNKRESSNHHLPEPPPPSSLGSKRHRR